ncbi:hypothetical protein RMSM_01497 [Rhodopirellula maiorica SM1]|uniref:Uncharacterized protein n=1 Tax=Rhodopirellula maiorica SM1 TaxID=1265738 RepID=M5S5V3_9BACT|nr:hypothetical protein RMSM_01497 [Rhodopirellula maiorica SM1]
MIFETGECCGSKAARDFRDAKIRLTDRPLASPAFRTHDKTRSMIQAVFASVV